MWYVHYYGQLTHLIVTSDYHGVIGTVGYKYVEHHGKSVSISVFVMGRGVTFIRE